MVGECSERTLLYIKELKDEERKRKKHDERMLSDALGPEEDTLCGFGLMRNGYMQYFATPITYLILSSTVALIQGIFFTYSNATLSTVEKRFALSSKLSGFTTTGNDFLQLCLSLPLPYIAGRSHRPRWLAFGMYLTVFSCFIVVIPHWMDWGTDLANASENIDYFCSSANNLTAINNCSKKLDHEITVTAICVVAILLIAQMLSGVASLLYYTIGYSYLDEAVAKEKVPLYFSISGGMRLLGPVCGYSLASWALGKWVDPDVAPKDSISPSHPQWIGAWWIGYLVIGTVLLSVSWLLALLPRTLPGTRQRRKEELQTALAVGGEAEFERVIQSLRPVRSNGWKELFPSLRRILSNKVYQLVVVNQVFFWFAFYGYVTFKSKYLEHQFRLSAAAANKYIAGVSLAATFTGWMGTGAAMSFIKPKPKTVVLYMATLSSISCLCHLLQLQISCDHGPIEGADQVYFKQNLSSSYDSNGYSDDLLKCSQNCSCPAHFSPICDQSSRTTFFSPCHAGCSTNYGMKNTSTVGFSNCSCIAGTETDKGEETNLDAVISGFCNPSCSSFSIYLTISVIARMSQAASRVPINLLLFRSVDERDKDVALGIFNCVLAAASSIPAPIIFGSLIDFSCRLWDNSCGERKVCWIYNMDLFRRFIHGLPAVFLALCFLTDLLLLRHHRKIKLYSQPSEKSKDSISLSMEDPKSNPAEEAASIL